MDTHMEVYKPEIYMSLGQFQDLAFAPSKKHQGLITGRIRKPSCERETEDVCTGLSLFGMLNDE